MSSVRFELMDEDGKVIGEGESHCRNILGDQWRSYIESGFKNKIATVRVIGFDSPITSIEGSHQYFNEHPERAKYFNDIFAYLLEKHDIKVELLKKNGTWKAYFSKPPSYPLVGLVLQFLRERGFLLVPKQEINMNEIMKPMFGASNYSHLGFEGVLLTAFYVFTIRAKRTLLLKNYDVEDGPVEYLQEKVHQNPKPETLVRFRTMLRRYKKEIEEGMTGTYYEENPPTSGDNFNSLVFKNLESSKLIKRKAGKQSGVNWSH
jgi:hypothetical protein